MPQPLSDSPFASVDAAAGLPGQPLPARGRQRRWLLLKLAVTLLILGLLVVGADWAALRDRLAAADPLLLAAGVAAKGVTLPLAALRWRAVGRAAGFTIARWDAFRFQMAGSFLGQVLPGSVGADLLRGWFTWRLGHPAAAVMLALLVDRLMALLGVVLIGLAGLPHLTAMAPPAVAFGVLGGAAVLGGGMLALLVIGAVPQERLPLPARLRDGPIGRTLWGAVRDLRAMGARRAAWEALAHSMGVHLATIAATVLFARALGLPLGWLDGLAIVPAAIVAAALPVSLGGWGVREGAMVAGFALLGFDTGTAFLVSVLIGLSIALLSLPGGVFWLLLRGEAAAPSSPSFPDSSR